MEPYDAVEMGRHAIEVCLMIGGPVLVAGLFVGLVIGAIQSMTGIHDQTVSFVPKLLILMIMIAMALPWFTDKLLDYARQSISQPMIRVGHMDMDPHYD